MESVGPTRNSLLLLWRCKDPVKWLGGVKYSGWRQTVIVSEEGSQYRNFLNVPDISAMQISIVHQRVSELLDRQVMKH